MQVHEQRFAWISLCYKNKLSSRWNQIKGELMKKAFNKEIMIELIVLN